MLFFSYETKSADFSVSPQCIIPTTFDVEYFAKRGRTVLPPSPAPKFRINAFIKLLTSIIPQLVKFSLEKLCYKFFASFAKTMSEGIMLGSSAAFLLPEAFQLTRTISIERYAIFLFAGLIFLMVGAILEQKGNA